MRARDYLTTEEMHSIAQGTETGAVGVMLAACRRERERVLKAVLTNARINTERVEDDVRFYHGVIRGLEFLGELQSAARSEMGIREDML